MIVTRVYPAPPASLDLDDVAGRDCLLEWYQPPTRKWLRANMVVSVGGSAAGSDGTSETLTNPTDRRILGVIRQIADVVLVGAQSVRAEGYRLPANSTLAIVTMSGDLTGHSLAAAEAKRVIVISGESAIRRARDTLGDATFLTIDSEDGLLPPSAIVDSLVSNGLPSIVCEGGPTLLRQLVLADLVDELCLTTSPLLGGGVLPPFGRDAFEERVLEPTQLLLDDGGTGYARWAIRAASPSR